MPNVNITYDDKMPSAAAVVWSGSRRQEKENSGAIKATVEKNQNLVSLSAEAAAQTSREDHPKTALLCSSPVTETKDLRGETALE